ncbi:hypothetical protein ACFUTX_14115 [Microbacterium sp. NPDC057407]|uniref:hypothetical protein n=1 Tax=Microbacterium sp. NPDC057407 TaxID=3346120 RepID=UPI003670C47B
MLRIARIALLSSLAFVAVTALAGGVALILGSLSPDVPYTIIPPGDYLSGSPFGSYLLPGLALILLVAAPHAWAFVRVLRRRPAAEFLSSAAGFACLIWIFVQMVYIPFSPLQAVYFAVGLLELGLTLLLLGVLDFAAHPRRSTMVTVSDGDRGSIPTGR